MALPPEGRLRLQSMSPLLVVTEDRRYGVAFGAGAKLANIPAYGSTAVEGARLPTALEPAFGELQQGGTGSSDAAEVSGRRQAAADAQSDAITRRWEALFDVPSHALPSVSTLCSSFLEILTSRQ